MNITLTVTNSSKLKLVLLPGARVVERTEARVVDSTAGKLVDVDTELGIVLPSSRLAELDDIIVIVEGNDSVSIIG